MTEYSATLATAERDPEKGAVWGEGDLSGPGAIRYTGPGPGLARSPDTGI